MNCINTANALNLGLEPKNLHLNRCESAVWGKYHITPEKTARAWLLLAPADESEKSHFQAIKTSPEAPLYLASSYNNENRGNEHKIERVNNLPEYILNDSIVNGYFGCEAGKKIKDIIAAYKSSMKTEGDVFLGKVDLPIIYEFTEPERDYFHFKPAFPRLHSIFSEEYIASYTNYDLFWETNTWNAFTSEACFFVSLILPNFEVNSKIKFSNTLNQLMLLPPDSNKNFPGGSAYREAAENFNSYHLNFNNSHLNRVKAGLSPALPQQPACGSAPGGSPRMVKPDP